MTVYNATVKDDLGRAHVQGQVEFTDGTVQPLPQAGGTMAGSIILPTGSFLIIGANAAPADAALAAGQCALWFDSTDAAAKLMMKAKQANGTVKTGAVNVQT